MATRRPPEEPSPRPAEPQDAHPIALVRRRLREARLDGWLLQPLGELTPRFFPHSRRGARLAERLAGDRPALTLSSAIAEIAGQLGSGGGTARTPLPRVLVDKLAFAIHRAIDAEAATPSPWGFSFGEGVVPGPVWPELRPLLTAVEALQGDLERQGFNRDELHQLRRRRSRVTLDEGPPPGFFFTDDPGPVPAGMLLAIDAPGAPLHFVGVRGPLGSRATQWYAADRIIDVIVEPLFDEGPRLRRLAGGRFGALLSALDDLVVVDETRPHLAWVWLPQKGLLAPALRGPASDAERALVDAALKPRALVTRMEAAVRAVTCATDVDRAFAAAQAARGHVDGEVARLLLGHPFVEDEHGVALRLVEAKPQISVGDDHRLGIRALGRPVAAADLEAGAALVDDPAHHRLIVVVADAQERALARAVAQLGDAPLPAGLVTQVTQRLKRGRVEVELPSSLRGRERPASSSLLVTVAFVAHGRDPVGGGARFQVRARPLPGGPTFLPGEGSERVFADDDSGPVWCRRGLDDERRRAGHLLVDCAVGEEDAAGPFAFSLLDPTRAIAALTRLTSRADVDIAVAHDAVTIARAKADELRVRFSERTDWLGVDGGVDISEGERLALRPLIEALRAGRRYVVLDDTRLILLEDALRDRLATVAAFGVTTKGKGGGELLVPAAVAGAVADDLGAGGATIDAAALPERFARADDVDGTPPPGIAATLRPYQQEGLRFLRRLCATSGGGVLADDMGLGKTLTAICLLVDRRAGGPQLVVAPTSLAHHWAREIARFAPGLLRPIVLADVDGTAARAEACGAAGAGDVVITSHGLAARDIDVLAPLTLQTLLVDEAQAVKNASTTRAQALRRLQARARIALSGTPIENHTGEVWAILDLVVPGLFGTFAQFKARFADPIEKDHDETRRALLARALRPFVLRRTKAQVAKDLPEKIERTVILTPSPEEQASYERLRRAIVVDLDERGVLDGEPGDDRSAPAPGEQRVQILAALTRLRLAACHPALVDDVLDEAQVRPATKHKALLSLLEEVRESGHRALVFSQFVSHLRLAERFAKDVGLRTQHLTGETPGRERQALVDRFQQGDVDAFFISLKAGGFGLNLTRATTVVHLDPWWNPATEDQASDRAHRIGQTLPVTIVRLVMDGTIEAPILALHEKKRALADAVLAGTDAAGRLDVRELASLLRHTRRVVGDDAVELAGAV
jgi:superfamily II DNA or RNA helicase